MKSLSTITLADVKDAMIHKGYKIFSGSKPNIVGIRNAAKVSPMFDDRCFVWWDEHGVEESHHYTITTNPGLYYLQNPLAGTKGTAILVPGQYIDCWEIAKHRGRQIALCQNCGEVRVYRDPNKDSSLDFDPKTIDSGYFGINLHNAGLGDPEQIGHWSAGCQVWQFHTAHEKLMAKCKELSDRGNFSRFSYTLLMQEDFA